MNNVIQKILEHKETETIFNYVLNKLYTEGPVSTTVLEILSYLYIYEKESFEKHNDKILKYMGVNYKDVPVASLTEAVFGMYKKHIESTYNYSYTPVQASIVQGIHNNQCFSFSAPTSTGKSFVFRNIIDACKNDVVIIVPSRALINEYYIRITEAIPDKTVNILTFIDRINTRYARRNIFIVTPERCKELFKHKNEFNIDYFLFDEAQLSNEESNRGLFFDSIVRRIQKSYPLSKFVFAHPFVANPEAQIVKNHFPQETSLSKQYIQKNVGQIFYSYDNGNFYHFGIDKNIMGKQKVQCSFDPISKAIENNGSVLIYTTKASIYKKTVFNDFEKYISLCQPIRNKEADALINQIKNYLGATDDNNMDKYSHMLFLLKKGIVVHHGSLPLQARLILEEFTQKGFCRICFATSTLEQGVNMPFEVVFLNTFQASRPLSLKNLIGRAGRSSIERKFDYGSVIVRKDNMSKFRDIMTSDDSLKSISLLEDDNIDDDYKDFKEAILSNTLSDEYNLTEEQLAKLTGDDTQSIIKQLLDSMFDDGKLISLSTINQDLQCKLNLYLQFERLYASYLKRSLTDGEKSVFDTAIKILIWKIHCKKFKDICFYRYAYASRLKERKELKDKIKNATGMTKIRYQMRLNNLYASFVSECKELPNKNLSNYSMFGNREIKAVDVDYDRIVFDTYDYLDKTIGFYLSDIFYAAFQKYYEATQDTRAEKLAKYVKYGTDNEKEIWMLRYGLTFEDIEWADDCIECINQEAIEFNNNIQELEAEKIDIIKRFIQNN